MNENGIQTFMLEFKIKRAIVISSLKFEFNEKSIEIIGFEKTRNACLHFRGS